MLKDLIHVLTYVLLTSRLCGGTQKPTEWPYSHWYVSPEVYDWSPTLCLEVRITSCITVGEHMQCHSTKLLFSHGSHDPNINSVNNNGSRCLFIVGTVLLRGQEYW